MDGFLGALSISAVGEVGGWIVLVASVVWMGRMFQTGKLLTEAQLLRELARCKENAEAQAALRERHFVELTAANRLAWQTTLDNLRASYEARLQERNELVTEARENFRTMMTIHQTNADGLADVARASETTERVLAAFETALGLESAEGDRRG